MGEWLLDLETDLASLTLKEIFQPSFQLVLKEGTRSKTIGILQRG
jgi:hypothetical protein